jgi:hypothetical protein
LAARVEHYVRGDFSASSNMRAIIPGHDQEPFFRSVELAVSGALLRQVLSLVVIFTIAAKDSPKRARFFLRPIT